PVAACAAHEACFRAHHRRHHGGLPREHAQAQQSIPVPIEHLERRLRGSAVSLRQRHLHPQRKRPAGPRRDAVPVVVRHPPSFGLEGAFDDASLGDRLGALEVVGLDLDDLLRGPLGGRHRRRSDRLGRRLGRFLARAERQERKRSRCVRSDWKNGQRPYRLPALALWEENSRKKSTMPALSARAEVPSSAKSADSSQIPPQLSQVSYTRGSRLCWLSTASKPTLSTGHSPASVSGLARPPMPSSVCSPAWSR